jgi:hypothetical protein
MPAEHGEEVGHEAAFFKNIERSAALPGEVGQQRVDGFHEISENRAALNMGLVQLIPGHLRLEREFGDLRQQSGLVFLAPDGSAGRVFPADLLVASRNSSGQRSDFLIGGGCARGRFCVAVNDTRLGRDFLSACLRQAVGE